VPVSGEVKCHQLLRKLRATSSGVRNFGIECYGAIGEKKKRKQRGNACALKKGEERESRRHHRNS